MAILIAGDLFPLPLYKNDKETGAVASIGTELVELIKASDAFVVNLEGPLTNSVEEGLTPNSRFRANAEVATWMREVGITAASLANNHIMDYGRPGLRDTVDSLRDEGITPFGYYLEGQDNSSLSFRLDDRPIGVVAGSNSEFAGHDLYSGSGAAKADPIHLIRKLRQMQSTHDFVVCVLHLGMRGEVMPYPYQRELSRFLIEEGAHVVLHQHSHTVGLTEKYKQGTIVYGQGHFCAHGDNRPERWYYGSIARLQLGGDGLECSLIYTRHTDGVIDVDHSGRVPELLSTWYPKFNDDEEYMVYWDKRAAVLEGRIYAHTLSMGVPLAERALLKAERTWGLSRRVPVRWRRVLANYFDCEEYGPLVRERMKR